MSPILGSGIITIFGYSDLLTLKEGDFSIEIYSNTQELKTNYSMDVKRQKIKNSNLDFTFTTFFSDSIKNVFVNSVFETEVIITFRDFSLKIFNASITVEDNFDFKEGQGHKVIFSGIALKLPEKDVKYEIIEE